MVEFSATMDELQLVAVVDALRRVGGRSGVGHSLLDGSAANPWPMLVAGPLTTFVVHKSTTRSAGHGASRLLGRRWREVEQPCDGHRLL